MDQNERDFENILGGAPKAAVKEFPKPSEEKETGELNFEDLAFAVGGLGYGVAVDYQKDKTDTFSKERIDREVETARMLGELQETTDESIKMTK